MKTLFCLFAFISFSSAQDWTTEDQILTFSYELVNLVDGYTTLRALDNPQIREVNPLLGQSKERIITFLALSAILYPAITAQIPLPQRRFLQYAVLSFRLSIVGNNVALMIRLKL